MRGFRPARRAAGEVVGAVVWMAPGSKADAAMLAEYLAERLAPYKVPNKIWLSAGALPKLGTEKIDKVTLRKQYREEYAAELAA